MATPIKTIGAGLGHSRAPRCIGVARRSGGFMPPSCGQATACPLMPGIVSADNDLGECRGANEGERQLSVVDCRLLVVGQRLLVAGCRSAGWRDCRRGGSRSDRDRSRAARMVGPWPSRPFSSTPMHRGGTLLGAHHGVSIRAPAQFSPTPNPEGQKRGQEPFWGRNVVNPASHVHPPNSAHNGMLPHPPPRIKGSWNM